MKYITTLLIHISLIIILSIEVIILIAVIDNISRKIKRLKRSKRNISWAPSECLNVFGYQIDTLVSMDAYNAYNCAGK